MSNYSELVRKLRHIKSVSIVKYSLARQIVNLLEKGNAQVLSKKWASAFKQQHEYHYPLDLTNFNNWTTYDDCIVFKFYLVEGSLLADIDVYDGDTLYGDRTEKRWTAKFQLPIEFIEHISPYIDSVLYRVAVYAHNQYLEEQKQAWVKCYINEIIK
jgi:hypothetical protein